MEVASRVRSGRRLPVGFASVVHTDGPYDYVLQDGRYYLIDTEKGRALDGSCDDEALELAMVARLNRLAALERETAAMLAPCRVRRRSGR